MRKILLCIIGLLLINSVGIADVDEYSDWAEEGIVSLRSTGEFKEEVFRDYKKNMTRLDFIYFTVKIYELIKGEEIQIDTSIHFVDTEDSYALKGASIGITSGIGNDRFGPDQLLSREEFAVLVIKTLKLCDLELSENTEDSFADEDEFESWAKESIYLAKTNSIISGIGNNKFNAKGQANIEQALVITNNILKKYRVKQSADIPLLKALSDRSLEGRAPGSEGYRLGAEMIADQLKLLNMKPVLTNLISEYPTDLVELVNESLIIDGQALELMNDYMPFSRSTSSTFSGNIEFIHMGLGQESDYSGKQVAGKVVVINWQEAGKFGGGILDRILIAKDNGAKAVFIIANGELPVGYYEHPLNGDDCGIYSAYITPQLGEQLKLSEKDNKETLFLAYDLMVKREKGLSQNVIGYIEGIDSEKSVLLLTNIDGFGKLPDGRVFENTVYSSVAPVHMIDMAKYYTENKPAYNIIFAFVGDKWTGNEGVEDLLKKMDKEKIILSLDLYSMANSESYSILATKNTSKEYVDLLSNYFAIGSNNDLGNSLSSVVVNYLPEHIFIRGNDSWIDNSLSDTYNNFDKNNWDQVTSSMIDLVDTLQAAKIEEDIYLSTYPTETVSYKAPGLDKVYRKLETKNFIVLMDKAFENQVVNKTFLQELDLIYNRIHAYNYYPTMNKKTTLIFSDDTLSAARIGKRNDVYDQGHDVGGGFASFPSSGVEVIFCKQPSLTTVSHELNHLMCGAQLDGQSYSVRANQEAQGQTYNIFYGNLAPLYYVSGMNTVIMNTEGSLEKNDASQIKIAKTYKENFDWDWFLNPSSNPYSHVNSYFTLGSMYSYVYDVYGPLTERRLIFRVYDAKTIDDLKTAITDELNTSEVDFLSNWSQWILSDGKDKPIITTLDSFKAYDYNQNSQLDELDKKKELIHFLSKVKYKLARGSENGTADSNRVIACDDNGFIDIDSQNLFNPNDLASVSYKNEDDNIILRFNFQKVLDSNSATVFLMGDTPGLKESIFLVRDAKSLNLKFTKEELQSYEEGLIISTNQMFIGINKSFIKTISQ